MVETMVGHSQTELRSDGEMLIRLEERTANISKSMTAHEAQDEDRFEKTLAYAREMKGEINGSLEKMMKVVTETNTKVGTLWDDKNKRDGALGLGKFMAGAIGGSLVFICELIIKRL